MAGQFLSWGQRTRTCWKARSLILGTKKEDLLCWRASSLILATKEEDLLEG